MMELLRLFSAVGFVVVLLVLLAAVSKTTGMVSRLWSSLWLVYVLMFLGGMRIMARWILGQLRKRGYDFKSILLVGNGDGRQGAHASGLEQ